MRRHDASCNGKPQPVSAGLAVAGSVGAVKAVKQMGKLFPLHRLGGGVGHGQKQTASLFFQAQGDMTVRRGVFEGVIQQDGDQLTHGFFVTGKCQHGLDVGHKIFSLTFGRTGKGLGHLLHHVGDRKVDGLQMGLLLLHTGQIDQIVGQPGQALSLAAVVCVVIMMVNGNVGTGVAVAGTFNLVRFRSVPGSAREIGAIFVAMGAGLITEMGYLGYGVLFTLVLGAAMMVYNVLSQTLNSETRYRTLHITIPEDLDYAGVFEPILSEYARSYTLTQVKTTNMGSLFKLTYDVALKRPNQEKRLIDRLRQRNGNLEISLCHRETVAESL